MIQKTAICPITYLPIADHEKYAIQGLKRLSSRLKNLHDLPYSTEDQIAETRKRADKLSIQGVQPKLSAKLNIRNESFEIADVGGTYILKPQNTLYPELPENEDLSMRLAEGLIEVPLHGLLYCIDGRFTYFIKRFDRVAHGHKIPVEDFAQLAGLKRDTKYQYSMEKLIPIIEKHCTFPAIEKSKLFTRVVFNYLIGNEDMHLKNFSLITTKKIIRLAPAYDFINTTIALGHAKEQIALPLNGKKNNLSRKDIVEYYGMQKLGLNTVMITKLLDAFKASLPRWRTLIDTSFLSEGAKKAYHTVLDERLERLGL